MRFFLVDTHRRKRSGFFLCTEISFGPLTARRRFSLFAGRSQRSPARHRLLLGKGYGDKYPLGPLLYTSSKSWKGSSREFFLFLAAGTLALSFSRDDGRGIHEHCALSDDFADLGSRAPSLVRASKDGKVLF